MVLDPIPQSLPVHFFGSRPQPPTSRWRGLTSTSKKLVVQCVIGLIYLLHLTYACVCRDFSTLQKIRSRGHRLRGIWRGRRRACTCIIYIWILSKILEFPKINTHNTCIMQMKCNSECNLVFRETRTHRKRTTMSLCSLWMYFMHMENK